jgi:hypothetical protein
LNFAKWFLIIVVVLGISHRKAVADPVPFTETSNPVAGNNDTQGGLITELKYQAVVDWLKSYLGPRFATYEKLVTHDFSEKYVLDYKVSRSTSNRAQIELNGHLDGDGLKAWIRVMETKARGNASTSPFLVLSSSVPGLALGISDTAQRLRDSLFAQTLLSLINGSLQRFNIHITSLDLSRVVLKQPPVGDTDISQLRDQAGSPSSNAALWLNFTPCKNCGGMHLDSYLYSLTNSKILLARSDDLALGPTDIANAAKIRTALKGAMTQFASDFDGLVGSGILQSTAYLLSIEGIDSYRAYKTVDSVLDNLDFVTQSSLKSAKSKNAVYEVLSPLTGEELSQRLGQQSFNGFALKPVRVDSRTLIVRYLRQP